MIPGLKMELVIPATSPTAMENGPTALEETSEFRIPAKDGETQTNQSASPQLPSPATWAPHSAGQEATSVRLQTLMSSGLSRFTE